MFSKRGDVYGGALPPRSFGLSLNNVCRKELQLIYCEHGHFKKTTTSIYQSDIYKNKNVPMV